MIRPSVGVASLNANPYTQKRIFTMKKVLYTAAIIAVTSLHPLPAHAQDANDSAEAAVMNVINYDETSFQEGPAEYFT